jgi:hypothetical protein
MGGGDRWRGQKGRLAPLLVALLALPGLCCSSFERGEERDGELRFVPLVCESPHVVTTRERVRYPEDDCSAAIGKAEGRLTSGHYRRACQQMAPAAGLPTRVVEVRATVCADAALLPDFQGGSVLSVDICCP